MLNEAVAFIEAHSDFLLIAHVAPDGDAFGSCLALQKLLEQLGKRMQIRAIPKFKFVLDEGIAYSVHIADLLNKLNLDGENKPDAE